MSLPDYNQAIIDYLTQNQMEGLARAFWEELGRTPRFDATEAERRTKIRSTIWAEEYDEAADLIAGYDPAIFVKFPNLQFDLVLAQLLSMVRRKEPASSVVARARETAAPLIERMETMAAREQSIETLNKVMSLLIVPSSGDPVLDAIASDAATLAQSLWLKIHGYLLQRDGSAGPGTLKQIVSIYSWAEQNPDT